MVRAKPGAPCLQVLRLCWRMRHCALAVATLL